MHGKVFYFWIPSFNPSFKGGSIGQLHIKQFLKICFDTNIEIFDFMGGNETCKVAGQINPMKLSLLAYRSRNKFIFDNIWSMLRKRLQNLKDIQNFGIKYGLTCPS